MDTAPEFVHFSYGDSEVRAQQPAQRSNAEISSGDATELLGEAKPSWGVSPLPEAPAQSPAAVKILDDVSKLEDVNVDNVFKPSDSIQPARRDLFQSYPVDRRAVLAVSESAFSRAPAQVEPSAEDASAFRVISPQPLRGI